MGGKRRMRQFGILRRDLDRVAQTIERAGEHRRHQTVLTRQRRDGLQSAPGTLAIGRRRIACQDVQLDQRHRGDRVFGQWLYALAEATQLVTSGAVEVAAELRIAVALLDVRGQVERHVHPLLAEAVLLSAQGRPQRPDLVCLSSRRRHTIFDCDWSSDVCSSDLNWLRFSLTVGLLTAMSAPVLAQWENVKTPNIPRTADGKPNLSAPAPKAPDGKPDLSGLSSEERRVGKEGRFRGQRYN